MTFDPALSAMMAEPWSNGACRGYVIMAMAASFGCCPLAFPHDMREAYPIFDKEVLP